MHITVNKQQILLVEILAGLIIIGTVIWLIAKR